VTKDLVGKSVNLSNPISSKRGPSSGEPGLGDNLSPGDPVPSAPLGMKENPKGGKKGPTLTAHETLYPDPGCGGERD